MRPDESLSALYQSCFGCRPASIDEIPACGSYRRYYRLWAPEKTVGASCASTAAMVPTTVIGAWNADKKENAAFVSFARSFHEQGLPVPAIYAVDEACDVYLQEDLGSESLYDLVARDWLSLLETADKGSLSEPAFPESLKEVYRQVLSSLIDLQIAGKDCIDYTKCTPCPAFHRDAIHWDLNYFKYFFLRLLRVPFDEQALEDDFRAFSAYLLETPCEYFLYRDFQSANIMLKEGRPCFIDFQGGRRGALQYDPASLLFDAKTRLPKAVRSQLTAFYVDRLAMRIPLDKMDFEAHYQGYTLCRLLQALAAFGLRGVVEHKPGFKESIPPALAMIRDLLDDWQIPVALPELKACLERMQSVEVS